MPRPRTGKAKVAYESASVLRFFLFASAAFLVLAGCLEPQPIIDFDSSTNDSGLLLDGGLDPFEDFDEDGLCNGTEISYSTNPRLADSDGDGFVDGLEVILATDPRTGSSPSREAWVFLPQVLNARAAASFSFRFEGSGQDVRGAIGRAGVSVDSKTALTFYDSAQVIDVFPRSAVQSVNGEVLTQLRGAVQVSVDLFFVDQEPHDSEEECVRAYPFSYSFKRGDSNVAYETRILVRAANYAATENLCRRPGCL